MARAQSHEERAVESLAEAERLIGMGYWTEASVAASLAASWSTLALTQELRDERKAKRAAKREQDDPCPYEANHRLMQEKCPLCGKEPDQ